jgi:hypothetical protein
VFGLALVPLSLAVVASFALILVLVANVHDKVECMYIETRQIAQARALSQTLRAHLRERAKMRELPAAVERWDIIAGAIFDLLRAAERAASEAQAATASAALARSRDKM